MTLDQHDNAYREGESPTTVPHSQSHAEPDSHSTQQTRPEHGQASNDQNLWIPGGRAFPEDDRRSHRILIKTSVGALAGRHARAH
ncbi:hypothetical protein, partial [Nocardia farcinica]|uniref:hypothetical protein n=1 Tax=Nocardia farcinica TaxID=37329 RepID=UPI001E63B475